MELMKKLIRKCPKCGTSYKLKEGKDLGYQYPVVLNCGHSACRGCVCSNSEYTCTHCQEVSIVKNVNIHTCVISWSSKNWMTLSKNGLQMTLEPLKSHSISSEEVDGNKGSCDECCIATAEVQCKICKIQVCQPCFQNIHSARTLSKHKAEPLYSFKFAMDVCSSHDVVCDHVCLTCSQSVDAGVFVCTECCVFGQHKKHQVMTLEEMNAGIAPQLKFVLEDAEMLNQRLQRLVKDFSDAVCSVLEEEESQAIKEAGFQFHALHGLLLLAEWKFEKELEDNFLLLNKETKNLIQNLKKECLYSSSLLKEAQQQNVKGQILLDEVQGYVAKVKSLLQILPSRQEIKDSCSVRVDILPDLRQMIGDPFTLKSGGKFQDILNTLQQLIHSEVVPSNSSQTPVEDIVEKKSCSDSKEQCTSELQDKNGTLNSAQKNFHGNMSEHGQCSYDKDKPFSQDQKPASDKKITSFKNGHTRKDSILRLSKNHFAKTIMREKDEAHSRKVGEFDHPSLAHISTQDNFQATDIIDDDVEDEIYDNENTGFIKVNSALSQNKDEKYLQLLQKGEDLMQKCRSLSKQCNRKSELPEVERNMEVQPVGVVNGTKEKCKDSELLKEPGSVGSHLEGLRRGCNASLMNSTICSSGSQGFNSEYLAKNHSATSTEAKKNCVSPHADPFEHWKETWEKTGAKPKSGLIDKSSKLALKPHIKVDEDMNGDSCNDRSNFNDDENPEGAINRKMKIDITEMDNITNSVFETQKNLGMAAISVQSCFSLTSLQSRKSSLKYMMEEEVFVSHIQSPGLFYVHRAVDYDELDYLCGKVNSIAKMSSQPKEIVLGRTYLGQFTHNDEWYRAVVLHKEEEGAWVEVHYIDYGNKEKLSLNRLRECPSKLQHEHYSSQAVTCGLWEIQPPNGYGWEKDANQIFGELVKDVKLHMLIVHIDLTENAIPKCQVELSRPAPAMGISNDLPVSIRETLIFLELAVYVNKSPDNLHDKLMPLAAQRSYFSPEIPFGVQEVEVVLSHFKTPHEFWVRLRSWDGYLENLMKRLQKKYSSPEIRSSNDWNITAPKIGMVCAARYSCDKKWYRAAVEGIPGRQMVDVYYVDFGNTERLWYKHIYKIPDDFLQLSAQAIKCRLQGVEPVDDQGWSEETSISVMELIVNSHILPKARFHSARDSVTTVSLEIFDGEESVDLSNILVNMKAAKGAWKRDEVFSEKGSDLVKDLGPQYLSCEFLVDYYTRSSTPSLPQSLLNISSRDEEDQFINVEFLSFTSPTCIHLRLASQSQKFYELQCSLQEMMQHTSVVNSFNVNKGDLCVATLPESEIYARVKVLEVDKDIAKVLLIDSGGIIDIPSPVLQPAPKMFSKMKRHAIIASLAGIHPPGGSSSWPGLTNDHLINFFSVKRNFYILRKGNAFKDPDIGVKILPVELGWFEETSCGPFLPSSIKKQSLNQHLIDLGLALPSRLCAKVWKDKIEGDIMETKSKEVAPAICDEWKPSSPVVITSKGRPVDETSTKASKPKLNLQAEHMEKPRWLPAIVPNSSTFRAKATYVDMQGIVSLHPSTSKGKLEFISDSITLQYDGTNPSDHDLYWRPGDLAAAKFHLDGKWYRAVIIKVVEGGEMLVCFVDYGNLELVKAHELRKCVDYKEIPVQSLQCQLYGIEPATSNGCWDIRVLDFVHKTVVEKECEVTVVSKSKKGILKVNLQVLGDINMDLATLLVDKMHVCQRIAINGDSMNVLPVGLVPERKVFSQQKISQTTLECSQDSGDDVVIESATYVSDIQDSSNPVFPPLPTLTLPQHQDHHFPVLVTAIVDPSHVYITPSVENLVISSPFMTVPEEVVQVMREESTLYNAMWNEVNRNPSLLRKVQEPVVGEIYIGFFKPNWYRAQALECGRHTIKVLYIDFGNDEEILRENLRECPKEFQLVPPRAVCVELYQVNPQEGPGMPWSEESMSAMIDCVISSAHTFYASIVEHGPPMKIDLFVKSSTNTSCKKVSVSIGRESTEDLVLAYASLVESGLIRLCREKVPLELY